MEVLILELHCDRAALRLSLVLLMEINGTILSDAFVYLSFNKLFIFFTSSLSLSFSFLSISSPTIPAAVLHLHLHHYTHLSSAFSLTFWLPPLPFAPSVSKLSLFFFSRCFCFSTQFSSCGKQCNRKKSEAKKVLDQVDFSKI